MSIQTKATLGSFGGKFLKLAHDASTTKCEMAFNLFLPPHASKDPLFKVPLLIFLAGLTCTADNAAEKGFFQHEAAEQGIAVLYPDTSPRGLHLPDEDKDWDFGTGASFYVDATNKPWADGYRMASYITRELPELVFRHFPEIDAERVSISGHSMGGHGALTLFLKNPHLYKSVSAFAPIANPSASPWGQKAFTGYFGAADTAERKALWADHDATELMRRWNGGEKGRELDILIDVGSADPYLRENQLGLNAFAKAAEGKPGAFKWRTQQGYDHGYYFVASFAADHIRHAARYLCQ